MYGMGYEEAEKNNSYHVHGGLTYSGSIEDADDGYHYFGFDTAHGGDFSPKLAMQMLRWARTDGVIDYHKEETYRTWDYVHKHVVRLATALYLFEKTGGGKSYA
jgi:hypothetical protein